MARPPVVRQLSVAKLLTQSGLKLSLVLFSVCVSALHTQRSDAEAATAKHFISEFLHLQQNARYYTQNEWRTVSSYFNPYCDQGTISTDQRYVCFLRICLKVSTVLVISLNR